MANKAFNNLVYFDGAKAVSISGDEGWQILTGGDIQSGVDALYSTVPWLFRAVQLRANAVSALPFRLMKGDTEYDNSATWKNRVGFMPSPQDILWLAEAAMTLDGRAYFFKNPNRAGRTAELRYWTPDSVTLSLERMKLGEIVFIRQANGGRSEWTEDQVLHLWYPDPHVEKGPPLASPGSSAMRAAGVIDSIDEFSRNFADRGFIRATILTVKGMKDPGEISRIEEWWNKFMRGINNAFRFKVFNAEQAVPVTVGEGFTELGDNTVSISRREDIAAAMGIPMTLLFSGSAAGLGGGGVAEQDDIHFYTKTVVPEAERIARQMTKQLFAPLGLRMEFLPETLDLFQTDEAQRSAALSTFLDALQKCPTADIAMGAFETYGMEITEELKAAIVAWYDGKAEAAAAMREQMAPAATEPENESQAEEDEEARMEREEMRRWKSKSMKALDKGKSPDVPFSTEHIPGDIQQRIHALLSGARTRADVSAAFDYRESVITPHPGYTELVHELKRANDLLDKGAGTPAVNG